MPSTLPKSSRKPWFTREKRWTGGDLTVLRIFGKEVELHWNWKDVVGSNSRSFVSLGWERGNTHYGILYQHYREGFDFASHTDGPKTNRVVSLLLNRPKRGGEFFCDGRCERKLGGRVIRFDGGQHPHGVTKIEEGSRSVLMFQRGEWR